MFIGTVVLGAVVGASKGASVRGALIRDVSAYALAVAMVAWILGSGQVSAAGLTLVKSLCSSVLVQQPESLVACCRSPRGRRCCFWVATWCMCWRCVRQTSLIVCGGAPRSLSTCEPVYCVHTIGPMLANGANAGGIPQIVGHHIHCALLPATAEATTARIWRQGS
jgi:hypothetical protein